MEFPRKEAGLIESDEFHYQITDWYIPEADRQKRQLDEEPELYNMILYGTTAEGNTVSLRVEGYEPHFYVKPPEEWETYSNKMFDTHLNKLKLTIQDDKYKCTYNKDGAIKEYQKKIVPYGYDSHLVSVEKISKKDFWGFTNNKDFRFIKITVKSQYLYNNLRYYFQSLKKKGFKLYESNIDPFLRYIHERNIKPCGWVTVTEFADEYEPKYCTRCDYNLVVNYANVAPFERNSIAPLMIASFDIECMSSHGDFPVAKKDYRKVAQDLANIAKAGYNITAELLLYWFKTMYNQVIPVDDTLCIHKAYAKTMPGAIDEQCLNDVIPDIIKILDSISNIADSDSEAEDDAPKSITAKEQNALEAQLNIILSKALPELKGDKIIQIGTTVHRYGSDNIIYKNIITLNSCDNIDGVDVVSCNTEKELLMTWKKLIKDLNPDILIGYNIFGFDMEYIWMRAQENKIDKDMFKSLGRNMNRSSSLLIKKLSSSALGENILKYFDMDGTVVIDLFKVMQRDHKLDSYKLDNVAQIFLGDQKDDLKPHEIFEKFKGTSADRCIIAKYCIQDCALVNRLLHKLKIIENNMGMANVCLVPFSYLFMRGQGIKIFSLIAKECMEKGFLIPVIRSFNDSTEDIEDGYEGAVVLEPKEGIYLNDPIVVFDYGSLYPSSMIARNLSHDCYVIDPKYKVDDPNIDYITVTYDIYEGVGDKKKKVGVKDCTFARYTDGRKGVIADILCMLLHQRKNTRKKMEYKTVLTTGNNKITGILTELDDQYVLLNIDTGAKTSVTKTDVVSITDTYNQFEQDVFDALQLAYKITANSLYGQIGARTSPIYLKDIAACTTATGREMIMLAKNFVETNYQAEVIYGDSVMPYTPLTYRTDHQIYVTTFEEANIDKFWMPYDNFRPHEDNRSAKEQYQPNNTYVWTHRGWSKIVRIIRHKTVKKIYRITTGSAIVDVTEDHSLLNSNAKVVKPGQCKIGNNLLHKQPDVQPMNIFNTRLAEYQGYIYGQFMATGKCYSIHSQYMWEMHNNDLQVLQKCKMFLEIIESHKFDISFESGKYILRLVYDVVNSDLVKFAEKYSNYMHIVLNGSEGVLRNFKEGYDDALSMQSNIYMVDIERQKNAQYLVIILQLLKYSVKLSCTESYIFIKWDTTCDTSDHSITDIKVLHEHYDGYVYDVETEEGVFHGGVGNMILKNTDSIFCKFPLRDRGGNPVYGKNALQYAIEIGKHVEKNIVPELPEPQKLNYEKSLYPFILFSKKRYVGNLYEMDDTHFKQKSMGIVLKRRDNAPIVKKIYGGIIDILLNKQDLNQSIEFLQEELNNLVQGKTEISDLIISKSLRASYKDASKIPHKVLADRMGERDPGNKPQVNDRIPFVYIKVPDAKLQGDRIENPEYIVENNLTPDYLHYITNQIMNPVLQLYALCLEELPNYNKSAEYWSELEETLKEKPLYKDDIKRKNRLDNLKLQAVKELLFDQYIDMLSEPKVRKVSTKKETGKSFNIPVLEHLQRGQVKINMPQCMKSESLLNATICVTKKIKSNITVSSAKILSGPKSKSVIWSYDFDNENLKNKTFEIMSIIQDMVVFAKDQNIKLNIKVKNNKQFIEDYYKSLAAYSELEKSELKGDNAIEKAIKEGDLGTMQSAHIIVAYMPLITIKDWFILER